MVTSAQFLIDSESSKSSDFQRMSALPGNDMAPEMDHSGHNMESGQMEMQNDSGAMDHSQMDHSEMGDSEMGDPEMEMDHSDMDHSNMDHDGGQP